MKSLVSKMTLIVSFVVATILVFVICAGYLFWSKELKKSISDNQTAMVTALSRQLDIQLATALEQLDKMALLLAKEDVSDIARLDAIFSGEEDARVFFNAGLELLSPDGRIITEFPLDPKDIDRDFSHLKHFKKAVATKKPFIGTTYINHNDDKATIPFIIPLLDGGGRLRAVLVGRHELDGDKTFASLLKTRVGRNGYFYIFDSDRTIVAHPDAKRLMEYIKPNINRGIEAALGGFEGTLDNVNSVGIRGLSSFKRLQSVNWFLGINHPVDDAYRPLWSSLRISLMLLVLAVLGSIVITRMAMSRMLAPMNSLTESIQGYVPGGERVQLAVSDDEVGRLGAAYKRMIDKIEDQHGAIQENSIFTENLVKFSATPSFVLDNYHRILFWNKALSKLTGMSSDQMQGTDRHWEAFYPDKRPTMADLVLEHAEHDIPEHYSSFRKSDLIEGAMQSEGWFTFPGMGQRFLRFHASPIHDAGGRVVAVVENLEDLTETKQMEDMLSEQYRFLQQAQEELLASSAALEAKHAELELIFNWVEAAKNEWEQTLDSLKNVIILTDAEHRIRRTNRMLQEIAGKSIEGLIQQDWREVLVEAGLKFVVYDGNSGVLQHTKTGQQFDLAIYEIRDPGSSVLTGQVISINDVTEIKEMTSKLEYAYSDLKSTQTRVVQQEKMASIGQMAAGVAHEINNPMGFITSNLNTLGKYMGRMREYQDALTAHLAGCGDDSTAQLVEMQRRLKIDYILEDTGSLVAESLEGAERVRKIVQDLKSFSRVDEADEKFADINQCLESTINIAWNEIKYVAELTRDFGEIPQVKCYPQQLNQVFMNLLVNAAHAISGHGRITVRSWLDGDNVLVSVTDSGSGIPQENQKRIFEPFFTTKEAGKGTGLGLSISSEIIRKHRGEITIESQVGQGTCFTVRLPVNYSEV